MNLNTKLEAITDKTLIIGIDVAKKVHVARVIDNRGAELCNSIRFENSRVGFTSFTDYISKLKDLHEKNRVMIGVEPTGVYGHALIAYLQSVGLHVVYILGMQVKRVKELEDNSPSKNDLKDAKVIASLVKDGYYRKIRTFTEGILELKEATRHALQLTKKLTRIKCQIDNFLTQYFPEFNIAFNDKEKKTAMLTLHLFPLPEQICALSADQIVQTWYSNGVIKGIGMKKALQLRRLAAQSIGIKATKAALHAFQDLMSEYDLLAGQEKETWERIKVLLESNKDFKTIMKIPRMTLKLTAYLLAEVGDFRDFSHPQQIVRLAGFNLQESSSGKNRGPAKSPSAAVRCSGGCFTSSSLNSSRTLRQVGISCTSTTPQERTNP